MSFTEILKLAFQSSIATRAITIALIVGTLLTIINQWEVLRTPELIDYIKASLTYITPFCVAMISATLSKLDHTHEQQNELHPSKMRKNNITDVNIHHDINEIDTGLAHISLNAKNVIQSSKIKFDFAREVMVLANNVTKDAKAIGTSALNSQANINHLKTAYEEMNNQTNHLMDKSSHFSSSITELLSLNIRKERKLLSARIEELLGSIEKIPAMADRQITSVESVVSKINSMTKNAENNR